MSKDKPFIAKTPRTSKEARTILRMSFFIEEDAQERKVAKAQSRKAAKKHPMAARVFRVT